MLVYMSLTYLAEGIYVIYLDELMETCTQVVPVVQSKPQVQVHLKQPLGGRSLGAHFEDSGHDFHLTPQNHQLLVLSGAGKVLKNVLEGVVIRNLVQTEEVHQVGAEELGYILGLRLGPESGLILPILSKINCNLPNVGHNEQPLVAQNSRVQAGDVPRQHIVEVLDE